MVEIFSWITERFSVVEGITLLLSFTSIIIVLIFSIKTHKQTSKFNEQQNEFKRQQKEFEKSKSEVETMLQYTSNKSSLMPFFTIILDDQDITIKNDRLSAIISLKNIGVGTAATLQANLEASNDLKYFFANYLSQNYALKEDIISLDFNVEDISEISNYSHGVGFSLEFSDLMGRIYRQKLYFMYDYKSKVFSQVRREDIKIPKQIGGFSSTDGTTVELDTQEQIEKEGKH